MYVYMDTIIHIRDLYNCTNSWREHQNFYCVTSVLCNTDNKRIADSDQKVRALVTVAVVDILCVKFIVGLSVLENDLLLWCAALDQETSGSSCFSCYFRKNCSLFRKTGTFHLSVFSL